jgi:hypothetical protein
MCSGIVDSKIRRGSLHNFVKGKNATLKLKDHARSQSRLVLMHV